MQCFCCDRELTSARKAKVRQLFDNGPVVDGKDSAAYKAYREATAYRWRVVCQACFSTLDNYAGNDWIDGRWFSMESVSRSDKATTIDEIRYRAWQRREAAKPGIELEDDLSAARHSFAAL
jgi:hypothetical protein